jgi:dipeptidyl aminopeptidase/acylaminoacyl peptidase
VSAAAQRRLGDSLNKRNHVRRLLLWSLTAAILLAGSSADPAHFGIYSSTLEGHDFHAVLTDPHREINHAHLSPDKRLIEFSIYNHRRWLGLGDAKEIYGYADTGISLVDLDGSGLRQLVPAQKGVGAVNGSWTPDGKRILFVEASGGQSHIALLDVASGRVTFIPTPAGYLHADPHQVGDTIVFTKRRSGDTNNLWLMRADGSSPHQLTHPEFPNANPAENPPLGDFDPKLSPDGAHVATMRHSGGPHWHIIVIDIGTGVERDLSDPEKADAVPEWSSDGKLLIFWHVDLKDMRQTGIYTMRPDGSARGRIPLPHGYFYTDPVFFPGDGSSPNARILVAAELNPHL